MTRGEMIRERHPKYAHLNDAELAKELCDKGACDRCYMRVHRDSHNRVKECREHFEKLMGEKYEANK